MARTTLVGLAITLSIFTGCAAAHGTPEVASGIYELTVHGEVDACSPTRPAGAMGTVGIVATSDVLNVAVPDVTTDDVLTRVSIVRRGALHTEIASAVRGCPGAMVRRSWTVTEGDESRFELLFAQEWTGLEGCADLRESMPAAPVSDCMAEQVLEYRLSESCAAPCEVVVTATGVACSC